MIHEVKQASPVTPHILIRLAKVVKFSDDTELVAWVGLLLGFYMFLRKSNLVPDTKEEFDGDQQFRRADINLISPFEPMMIEIRWSKTIQFKQRVLRFPVLPAKNKNICPVFWTHIMLNRIPAQPHEPALAIKENNRTLCLSANQLIYRFRKWLKLIGEDEMQFSLHSLRRGGATFAYQCDIEAEMIKLLGDWSSDAYKRYIDISMDKRYDSMKAFVEALNKMCE